MTLQITISPEAQSKLRERAEASGEDVAAYAARLVQDAVTTPTVEELLAPFRTQVRQSGMSDAELDAFCEELREQVSSVPR